MGFVTSSSLLFFLPRCDERTTMYFWTDRALSFTRRWDSALSSMQFAMPTRSYRLRRVGSYFSPMHPQAFTAQKEDGMMRSSLWPSSRVERTAATRFGFHGDGMRTAVVAVVSALPTAVAHPCRSPEI